MWRDDITFRKYGRSISPEEALEGLEAHPLPAALSASRSLAPSPCLLLHFGLKPSGAVS